MNKYRNKKILTQFGEFDSKKEYHHYLVLLDKERVGEISNIRRQVKYVLIPAQKMGGKLVERPCTYVADFVYEQDGKTVVEDVKGYRQGPAYSVFTIKRKLMLKVYGIKVVEI